MVLSSEIIDRRIDKIVNFEGIIVHIDNYCT